MPAQQDNVHLFTTKKCPYCESYLAIEDRYCPSCNKRVGRLDKKTGMAKQPVNWIAYIVCILYWAFLGLYLWWAFGKQS